MGWWLAGLACAGLILFLLRHFRPVRTALAFPGFPAAASGAVEPVHDITEARARLNAVMSGRKVTQISVVELCDILGLPRPEVGPLKDARTRQLGALLDQLDVGFEPDPRYGAIVPSGGGRVMLFGAAAGAPVEAPSPLYVAARAVAEAAAVAVGDAPDRAAYGAVSGALKRMDGLGTHERMRLLAGLGALFADPPGPPVVEARLAGLPQEARSRVNHAVAAIVAAEAEAASAHARFLDRLCRALDLPAAGRLRALGGRDESPLRAVAPQVANASARRSA